MPHDKEPLNNLTTADRIQANMSLATLKAASIVPTQWAQVIMRWQQAAMGSKTNPRALSAVEAAREIYYGTQANPILNRSLKRFFNGSIAGSWKEFLKNGLYKGIFITEAPLHADTLLRSMNIPDYLSPNQYLIMKSFLAGTGAAVMDTAISGPLEGWATFRATSQGTDVTASFWKEVFAKKTLPEMTSRAYQGGGAAIAKGSASFSTFFLAADGVKTRVAQALDIPDKKDMPWYASISSALITGGFVAFVSSAFDVRKTQRQMPNAVNNSMYQSFMNDYKRFGLKGPLAGLPLKFLMIALGWGITDIATQPGPFKTWFKTWFKSLFESVSADEFGKGFEETQDAFLDADSVRVSQRSQGFFHYDQPRSRVVMGYEDSEDQASDRPFCFP